MQRHGCEIPSARGIQHSRINFGEAVDGLLDLGAKHPVRAQFGEHFIKRPRPEAMQSSDRSLKPDFAQVKGLELIFRRECLTRAVFQAAFSSTSSRTAGATRRERRCAHTMGRSEVER